MSAPPAAQVRPRAVREPGADPAPGASAKPLAAAQASGTGAAATAILVLRAGSAGDADPLSEQLRAFGFDVQVRRDPPDLPAPWPFAAVFVDQALRPAGGCARARRCTDRWRRRRRPGVLKPVLVLVADQLTPTNRVRAGLAGCNEILQGAITRGGVAKVLDTRGIKLPSDARRT